MALGGGTWLFQNKKLPGTYINFVSKDRAMTDIADRGYAALALEFDWGKSDEIVRVDAEAFQKHSQELFGYDFGHDKMRPLRELFRNLKTAYIYRLNGGGEKASCTQAKALCAGTRGNDLSVSIQADPDLEEAFVVTTYLKTDEVLKAVDRQAGVKTFEDLQSNDFVEFTGKGKLTTVANSPLSGGSNGSEVVVGDYQKFLELIEAYYFNILAYAGSDTKIQDLFVQFTKRCRDDLGAKFQLVIYGKEGVNYEGVISLKNKVKDKGAEVGSLVYWLAGAEASCAMNASITNKIYDGEYDVDTALKQYELEQAMRSGMLILHSVSDSVSGNVAGDTRVLTDINTFTEFTKDKNGDFSLNQVIRVLDNLAIDLARIFNRAYLGKVQNDRSGRVSLWKDGVALFEEYQRVRAIQEFAEEDLPIPTQGQEKTAVLWTFHVQPTACMEKLYVSVIVA